MDVYRQGVVADDQDGLGHDVEVGQESADVAGRGKLEPAFRVPQDDLHGEWPFMETGKRTGAGPRGRPGVGARLSSSEG